LGQWQQRNSANILLVYSSCHSRNKSLFGQWLGSTFSGTLKLGHYLHCLVVSSAPKSTLFPYCCCIKVVFPLRSNYFKFNAIQLHFQQKKPVSTGESVCVVVQTFHDFQEADVVD